MLGSIVGGDGSHGARQDETGSSGHPPTVVEALPYPARRLPQVQQWPELPSASISYDSSQSLHDKGGGMPGGGGSGGGGSARVRSSQKSWKKSPASLSLSAPLLPPSDSKVDERSRSAMPGDRMTVNDLKHGGSIKSSSGSSSVESQESGDVATEEAAGSGGSRSRAPRRGLQRRVSTRQLLSGTMAADMKTTERFAQPLVSEGEGSVFPIALPLAKRRVYEVEFIKQFDRLAINPSAGDFWTIIDATWMNEWIDFIMGKKPPPGPISNYELYNRESALSQARRESLLVKHAVSTSAVSGVLASHPHLTIKEGLQIVKDYRAIHPLVWFILREIYDTDGSPDIFRWKSDVYSAEVVGSRKARMVEEVHTKALYKLRRFSARVKEAVDASAA